MGSFLNNLPCGDWNGLDMSLRDEGDVEGEWRDEKEEENGEEPKDESEQGETSLCAGRILGGGMSSVEVFFLVDLGGAAL